MKTTNVFFEVRTQYLCTAHLALRLRSVNRLKWISPR